MSFNSLLMRNNLHQEERRTVELQSSDKQKGVGPPEAVAALPVEQLHMWTGLQWSERDAVHGPDPGCPSH